MKKCKIITSLSASILLLSTLMLASCGSDDSDNPKLDNKQNKTENKESDQGGNASQNSSDPDDEEENSNDKPDLKDDKSKTTKLSASDKLFNQHNKNDTRVDNNEDNLPKRMQDLTGRGYADDMGYSSVKGEKGKKEDITDYLREKNVKNPDKTADKKIYDKVEKQLNESYDATKDFSSTKDPEKAIKEQDELVDKYFYEEDEQISKIKLFAMNKWEPDYDTLTVTQDDANNVYIWQVSFKDKDGKKMGSLVGYYYDFVDSISLLDGGVTNDGATKAKDKSQKDHDNGV